MQCSVIFLKCQWLFVLLVVFSILFSLFLKLGNNAYWVIGMSFWIYIVFELQPGQLFNNWSYDGLGGKKAFRPIKHFRPYIKCILPPCNHMTAFYALHNHSHVWLVEASYSHVIVICDLFCWVPQVVIFIVSFYHSCFRIRAQHVFLKKEAQISIISSLELLI